MFSQTSLFELCPLWLIKALWSMFPPGLTNGKQVCLLSQRYPKRYHPTLPPPASQSVLNAAIALEADSGRKFLAVSSLRANMHTLKAHSFAGKERRRSFFSVAGVEG